MLSLPLITPRTDASLWPSHRVSNTYLDAPSTDPQNPAGQRQPHAQHAHHAGPSRSLLAALSADENVIDQRKQNVRRFGAGWIRPPGVAKTYQATMDEAAEREEQEILARREQVLLDLAAAQQDATNEEARAEGEDEDMGEGERDLDDEVPEAEADDSNSDISDSENETSLLEEGDTSALGGGHTENMTFNDDSFIEGSTVAAEVEHMLEMEEAEMAGVLQDERDLDDDVPEAGSYEHTDSELEDSSSGGEGNVSRGPAMSSARRISGRRTSGRRRSSGVRSGRGNRSSILDGSSLLDGSSFLRSSPAAARENLRSRIMGPRAPRGA
ncbi:hypothetical protein K504DRAFT_465927 [Pleomassaria siparia CBS 279.74]|uniref:Uncharacterized protein n=1 Tax=Pleomassaria siparia CBS 279.74 TaxID=1314801 RepID=A0A6G1KE40_9PLEO|nr:hypothetical protein K504DRAFT_465927 [Pleomassaria siparia CBS 279.74]